MAKFKSILNHKTVVCCFLQILLQERNAQKKSEVLEKTKRLVSIVRPERRPGLGSRREEPSVVRCFSRSFFPLK